MKKHGASATTHSESCLAICKVFWDYFDKLLRPCCGFGPVGTYFSKNVDPKYISLEPANFIAVDVNGDEVGPLSLLVLLLLR